MVRYIVSFVFAVSLAAQTHEFEVASIRANPNEYGVAFQISGPNVIISAPPLLGLISMAYNMEINQIAGGTDWMLDERFAIRAKAPGDTAPTRELAGLMLQSLLADRFQLKMHREKRDLPVYFLVVAKDGLKLKPSAPGAESSFQLGSGVMTQIAGTKQTMEQLAHGLTGAGVGRPVIDRTGIAGTYDFKLRWTPDLSASDKPSIFAVLQEAGLKLESGKSPTDVLVIDHAERPSDN